MTKLTKEDFEEYRRNAKYKKDIHERKGRMTMREKLLDKKIQELRALTPVYRPDEEEMLVFISRHTRNTKNSDYIVKRYYMDGLSIAEVAEELDLAIGSIARQISRFWERVEEENERRQQQD